MTLEHPPSTYWSLSEFLNLLELRSQCWCFAEIGRSGGFAIPHNETILFYAVLKGTAWLADTSSGDTPLSTGDIVMVLSGDAHALRSEQGGTTKVLDFLHNGEYIDIPPTFTLCRGRVATRLLCGRLKVRWPGGQRPKLLPPVLRLKASEGIVNFQSLESSARRSGAAAVLTRSALALFLFAFSNHPECEQIFKDSSLHDPISRALQFIDAPLRGMDSGQDRPEGGARTLEVCSIICREGWQNADVVSGGKAHATYRSPAGANRPEDCRDK